MSKEFEIAVENDISQRMRNRTLDNLSEVLDQLKLAYAKDGYTKNKEKLEYLQTKIVEIEKQKYSQALIAETKTEVKDVSDSVESIESAVSKMSKAFQKYVKTTDAKIKALTQAIESLCKIQLPIVNITGDAQFMPSYANSTDACQDLRAYITNEQFREYRPIQAGEPVLVDSELRSITLEPGQWAKISSGIKVAIPEGYTMKMYVRSSTGIKKQLELMNGTGIIDAGYRDEVFMCLRNAGTKPVTIAYGDRLCQFDIMKKIEIENVQVEDNDDFKAGNRGGGIGSTGTK